MGARRRLPRPDLTVATGPDPHEDLLARLLSPNVGQVGAREMLREVLRRLPGAWDPRVLDAARAVTRRFPVLAGEFPVLEQLAAMRMTTIADRGLGLEATVLASIEKAGRTEAERLFADIKTERGREREERARLLLALGKRLLALHDRKNGRAALREAHQKASPAMRAEIDAILDDLPGAKGREWRPANGTVVIAANPSEPTMLSVKGRDVPARGFIEERMLGAPLLSPCTDPKDSISIPVTIEHDAERVRTGSVRPRDTTTAPMIGLIARDPKGRATAVVCGAFVSPIERFPGVAIAADVTHVSVVAGASFAETRLEPVGPPKEGDGWLVMQKDRPFVRTRSGCWLRHPQKTGPAPADSRVRFQVSRTGMVWVAVNVKPVAG